MRDIVAKRPDYNDYLRVYSGDSDFRTNRITAVKRGEEDSQVGREPRLDQVFKDQVDKSLFYDTVKKPHVCPEKAEYVQMTAYLNFYNSCVKAGQRTVINPRLINFWRRTQYLYNTRVTMEQAAAVKRYLMMSREYEANRLRELVIDSC